MKYSRFIIVFLFSSQFLVSQVTDFSGMSFCFDPGHGYHGNPGVYGYSEAEKNLRVALYCLEYFTAMNADTVISTRYSDNEDPSLSQRENIANSAGVTWFHSIHSNAGSWWVNNVLVLYEEVRDWNQLCPGSTSNYIGLGIPEWPGQSDVLGNFDSDWIGMGFRIPSLGGFLDWTFYGGCTSGKSLGVLNDLTMPGELSEAGYHTNPTQNLLCMNEDWKRIQARAHLESFKQYFGIPHSGFNTITGIVRDEDTGYPLNGVTVVLHDMNGVSLSDYTTDTFESLFHNWCTQGDSCSNGFYIFENCSADSYMLTYELPFYYPDTVVVAVEDTQWTFADHELVSSLPPRIVWTSPDNGDTSASVNANWKIRFSRKMDTETVVDNISIQPSIEGTFYWEMDDHQLVFDPQFVLDFNTTYTLTINEGASDPFGHFIDGNSDSLGGDAFTLTFKTSSTDRFPPVIEDIFPPLSGEEIHPLQPVNFTFNEPLDENSIGEDQFLWMTSDQDEVNFSVDYHVMQNRGIVSLVQQQPLPADPQFQINVFAGISDLYGNETQEYLSFNFSSGGQIPSYSVIENFSGTENWTVLNPGGAGISFFVQDTVLLLPLADTTGAGIIFSPDSVVDFYFSGTYTGSEYPVIFMPVFSDGNNACIQLLFSESEGNGEASHSFYLENTGWSIIEFDPFADSSGFDTNYGNGQIEGELTFSGFRLNTATARFANNHLFIDEILCYSSPLSAQNDGQQYPDKIFLGQNYPNPFNSSTTVPFSLSEPGNVRIEIFDISGRLINTLFNENLSQGSHSLVWNGKDISGKPVPSGIYFIRLSLSSEITNTEKSRLKRCLLLK